MTKRTAVLFSAGLDSAVLLADESRRGPVHPLYVSVGLAWENAETEMAAALLASPVFDGRVEALERLRFTMEDVYPPSHWAIRGVPPAYDTPDEDVYLVGRNLVLLAKAGTWCCAAPRVAHRPWAAGGQPVPGRDGGVLRDDGEGVVAGAGIGNRDRSAVSRPSQRRRDSPGNRAGRAVRADAVVHAADPAGRGDDGPAVPALRRVQQMQGTAGGVSGGRRG